MKRLLLISFIAGLLPLQSAPLFNMAEMLDASTLEVKVLKDWHVVRGEVATRQKLITIQVGELLPGKEYRVPVRMIVPANRKAKGFHLTGGHNPGQFQQDLQPRSVDRALLAGGWAWCRQWCRYCKCPGRENWAGWPTGVLWKRSIRIIPFSTGAGRPP